MAALAFGCAAFISPAAAQSGSELDGFAAQAVRLLNEARREEGMAPLQVDPALARLASRHSQEQAERGRVSHHSYEFGLSTERRVRIAFPTVPRLAENVARNRTVARLHEALMLSDGHRRNRMDSEFTHVGIGLARESEYLLYMTEVFVTAPSNGTLGEPLAFYFDAAPGTYEKQDDTRAESTEETFTIGPPGPDNPEYWTSRGISEFFRGQTASAEASFRRALALEPEYAYASYNLARVLVNQARPAEAVVLLDDLLAADPDDANARLTRGTAALLLEDYAGAEADFRRVLESRPTLADAWYNLGLALEYTGRLREAEDAYRTAIEHDSELTAARVALGRVIR